VAKEIAEKQKEYVIPRTINNYHHRKGLKSFHVIPKPLKSDRLWLCNWLKDWTEEDFLHLAPSDEFFGSGLFIDQIIRIIEFWQKVSTTLKKMNVIMK